MPGAGKSTLAKLTGQELARRGHDVEILDGDIVRKYFGHRLGFSKDDRDENVRRVGFCCHLLSKHGTVAIAALISPYRATREEIRALGGSFVEVYVKASLEACVRRDPKGLYKEALAGKLKNFTGLDDPYEPPLHAEIEIDTEQEGPDLCTARILASLEGIRLIGPAKLSVALQDNQPIALLNR